MNINTITAEDLRCMPDKEGLILQGCGGDLTEWVDGINEMLTKAGILKDGSQFENVAAFQHGDRTCLLYPFDDVKLDIGKLALWRLQTHEVYRNTGNRSARKAGRSPNAPIPRIFSRVRYSAPTVAGASTGNGRNVKKARIFTGSIASRTAVWRKIPAKA